MTAQACLYPPRVWVSNSETLGRPQHLEAYHGALPALLCRGTALRVQGSGMRVLKKIVSPYSPYQSHCVS